MIKKIKDIFQNFDRFLYKKFGSNKTTKFLENISEAREIFYHLNNGEEENKVRFVGGCVRKSISGGEVDDIDLATSLEPNNVKKKLNNVNIKIIDSGILHGTLTLILNKRKFEITTLRKDIFTDGRHAEVSFTSNWDDDAKRRDFTINAIYSDIEGRIFDPQNGIEDLKNGKIKFIGEAKERIQEDYLRILRYFRFFIQYSKKDHDENVISSIKQNINGLNKVSNERIFTELKKIFVLKNINNLFLNKTSNEIILNIFPQFKYYERLKKLTSLGKKLRLKYDVNLILAIIMLDGSNEYEYFCHKYKTSNDIKDRFKNISINFENLKNNKFFLETNIKKLIYLHNRNDLEDLLLFSIFVNKKIKVEEVEKLLNYIKKYKVPKFPVSGEDLKDYGYESGKLLGEKLKLLEKQWIENNFYIDKKKLKELLGKFKKN